MGVRHGRDSPPCARLQVAPFEQLESLPHLSPQDLNGRRAPKIANGGQDDQEAPGTATERLMAAAARR